MIRRNNAVEYEEGSEEELADLRLKLQAAIHLLQQNELLISRYEDIVAGAIVPQPLVVDSSTCTSSDFSELRRAGVQSAEMAYGREGGGVAGGIGEGNNPLTAAGGGGVGGMTAAGGNAQHHQYQMGGGGSPGDPHNASPNHQGGNPHLDAQAQVPYESYVGQKDPYNPDGLNKTHSQNNNNSNNNNAHIADLSTIHNHDDHRGDTRVSRGVSSSGGAGGNDDGAVVPYLLLNSLEAQLRREERRRQYEEHLYLMAVDAVTDEAGRLVQLMRAVAVNSKVNMEKVKSGKYRDRK